MKAIKANSSLQPYVSYRGAKKMGFDVSSRHFSIEQLAEGVYAAIHKELGAAICNAGLIDLGGQIVVFDTFLTPQAAKDLLDFSVLVFGRAPDLVINSHYHNDHTWGNQSLAGHAKIITSSETLKLLETEGKAEFDWYKANSVEQLRVLRQRYGSAQDAKEKEGLLMMIGYYEGLIEALPTLVPVKPDITFDGKLTLRGKERTAELITFDQAHSGSDTVLYLPREGVLFMGDLLFVEMHPYLQEGDPEKLIEALMTLSKWDASCYVPGHGGLGTLKDISALIEYAEFCMQASGKTAREGAGKDSMSDVPIPDKFASWGMPSMFRGNLNAIFKHMHQK